MNKIKILAGQTALYGISSILGRTLNFLLVPLHTEVFAEGQFGSITQLYAYVAVFNILYTYGMETAFFRFSTKEKTDRYYHLAASSVLITSFVISTIIFAFANDIASFMELSVGGIIIKWLAAIMFLDAVVALPFAKLRLENKAVRFVVARVGGIAITLVLNFLFLVILRDVNNGDYLSGMQTTVAAFYSPSLQIGYVFLANLIGSASLLFFLWREIIAIRLRWQWVAFRPVLIYALPIMLTGLAGMLNENLDKILIPRILPNEFYTHITSIEALGIYSGSFKLGIFMMLAIQAFRFAAEPFFFSNAKDRNAPELFANVMQYFVALCSVLFVAVSFNIDLIARLFLRNESYWQVLYLVPIFLMAKLLFGIYVNLSIWYKLKDKTIYGTYFTVVGTMVTVLGNVLLIPILGLKASAITAVLCYGSMCLLAYGYGRKYFPIPYRLGRISIYVLVAAVLAIASFNIRFENLIVDSIFNITISLIYFGAVIMIEKSSFRKSAVN